MKNKTTFESGWRFWLLSPLTALVSFLHEIQAAIEIVPSRTSWLWAEDPQLWKNQNSLAFPDLAVLKVAGLSHAKGPVAILLPWCYKHIGCLWETEKKMSPPGRAIAISCPSGKHPLLLLWPLVGSCYLTTEGLCGLQPTHLSLMAFPTRTSHKMQRSEVCHEGFISSLFSISYPQG